VNKVVRVLVVDDSAYVRKVLKEILSRSPFVEVVGAARDGEEALELVEQLKPDVVTLDLIMPRMDGITFLREQMKRRPLPVVIVSITSERGELMLQALEAGALDMVQKPTALATEKVFDIAGELIEKVKAAAGARMPAPSATPLPNAPSAPVSRARAAVDIVVLGISTGGPQALKFLIPQLPADFPVPIAMVLHMPVGYTELYARSLGEVSKLRVAEAREGDEFQSGVALLAPGGRHLSCRRGADGAVSAHLGLSPADTLHRPAVDVLFRSAAEVFGSRVLGVVMSGMGSDGTEGAAWIKAQGGRVFTEAEETCVVYGMPRSVAEAGLSDRSVPLTIMAQAIMEAL
jgi:two-component system, chemotaxis family, protein-glutamate methylesterase/glutaminase